MLWAPIGTYTLTEPNRERLNRAIWLGRRRRTHCVAPARISCRFLTDGQLRTFLGDELTALIIDAYDALGAAAEAADATCERCDSKDDGEPPAMPCATGPSSTPMSTR